MIGIILALFFFSTSLRSAPLPPDEAFPKDWYLLPEQTFERATFALSSPSPKAIAALDRTLRANGNAFDLFSEERVSRNHWSLSQLSVGLSISSSGIMGALIASGQSSAFITWVRPEAKKKNKRFNVPTGATEISGDATVAQVKEQLEPIIQSVLSTNKVKNEANFRSQLLDTVLNYQSLVSALDEDWTAGWYVSQLQLSLSVDVLGSVTPSLMAGGGVTLNFYWIPPRRPIPSCHFRKLSVRQKNLSLLLRTLANEFQQLDSSSVLPPEYQLGSVQFGLGFAGYLNFGIAYSDFYTGGTVYLKKHVGAGPLPASPNLMAAIPIISRTEISNDGKYSNEQPPPHEASPDGSIIYHLSKSRFRKGMARALKIGGFLASRAARHKNKHWIIDEVDAYYTLSLTGITAFVQLGGYASLGMSFYRSLSYQ